MEGRATEVLECRVVGGLLPGGMHVAAVRIPSKHLLAPETLYPGLHVGWHCEPDASMDVQLPTAPFTGAVDALQAAKSKFRFRNVALTLRRVVALTLTTYGEYIQISARCETRNPSAI